MITNNVTKKYYIGMSINLKDRINDYLNKNWLIKNRSWKIHKALLKYGFENFSLSILQLDLSQKTNFDSCFCYFFFTFAKTYNWSLAKVKKKLEKEKTFSLEYLNHSIILRDPSLTQI